MEGEGASHAAMKLNGLMPCRGLPRSIPSRFVLLTESRRLPNLTRNALHRECVRKASDTGLVYVLATTHWLLDVDSGSDRIINRELERWYAAP